jgi:flavin-binding protein dodecin
MTDHVYKHIQLTGTSSKSIEDAVAKALARASQTIHNMRWFEIVETRGQIDGGKVGQWQTTIRVGFTLDG